MSWTDAIRGVLDRYDGRDSANQNPHPQVNDDYDQVTKTAPPEAIAQGLNHTFNSDSTPPFAQMVSQLFDRSTGPQKAGLLNTLLGAIGGGGKGAGSTSPALAGILGRLGSGSVTSDQAAQIPTENVQQLAQHAEQRNPAVVDQVSNFYSQHPQLIKTIGAAALTVFMARLAKQHNVM